MISQAQIDSLPELRRAMAFTTNLHDSRRLRSRYLMRVVEVRSQVALRNLLDKDPDELEIIRWFHGELYRIAKDELAFGWKSMWSVLSPAQRFQAVSLSFDPDGLVKPPAGSMPADITNSQMSLTDILLRISPLLVLRGDLDLASRMDKLFDPMPSWWGYLVESGRGGTTWRSAVSRLLSIVSSNRLFPVLMVVLRHEAMRIFNDVDETFAFSVANSGGSLPAYVGYTLRSQNLPTTDPEHAAKDGWKFFRDDREGRSLTWNERIVPPYRRNCACYMVPILEEPTDPAFTAQYRLPIGKGFPILIRDPFYFVEWFDRQSAFVQKKLVGEKRWFAASSKGVGGLTFADFILPAGKVLSPRRLMDESYRQRITRRTEANLIMFSQSTKLRDGWSKRSDLDELLNPAVEAEYRDKLLLRYSLMGNS